MLFLQCAEGGLIFFHVFDMIGAVTVMRERVICKLKADSEPMRVEVRRFADERPSQTARGKIRLWIE
jgi:hypothetical protein